MNILLITSGVNNDKNSSWLVFSKFISIMKKDFNAKINIISFSSQFNSNSGDLGEVIYNVFFLNRILISLILRLNKQYLWFISKFYARFYSKKIIRYIEYNKIDKLWVNSDLLLLLTLEAILKEKTIPYHISVLDDPFKNKGYIPFIEKAQPIFNKLFKNASSIDTPTPYLYNFYKNENIISENTKTTESCVGVFKNSPFSPKIEKRVRKIALTGSIYGIDALITFLTAISDILIKEKIEFHLTTNTFNIHLKYLRSKHSKAFEYIKIMPFIPENKIINELQNYDLLYLPMKFDESYRFQTNSSFPSKTHNYLASQVPIIVHTPKSSSLNDFFTENQIGCVIDTLNPDEIRSKFTMLFSQDIRQEISNKIKDFNRILVKNNHVKKLYDLITEHEN